MLNYPEIMLKYEDEPKIRSISYSLKEKDFITKGKAISSTEVYTMNSSNKTAIITKEELSDKQKKQINYLSTYASEVIRENIKINNLVIGASLFMITTSLMIKVPLFGLCFAYFGGSVLKDNLQIIKLNNQIKNDKWFSDNELEVNESLDKKSKLYKKLSSTSKELLIRDGKITLNNIDEFPKNDLRLVRRCVSRKIKQEEKQKTLTR